MRRRTPRLTLELVPDFHFSCADRAATLVRTLRVHAEELAAYLCHALVDVLADLVCFPTVSLNLALI